MLRPATSSTLAHGRLRSARSTPGFDCLEHHQDVLLRVEAESRERCGTGLRLAVGDLDRIGDQQRALALAQRQSATQCRSAHLLGQIVGVVARNRTEDGTAARPLRRSDRALTSATGALLLPRLDATARDGRAILRRVRTRAPTGELATNLGVEEVRPHGRLEHGGIELDAPRLSSACAHESFASP